MTIRKLGGRRGFGDLADDDIFGDSAPEPDADADLPSDEQIAEDWGEGVFNTPDGGAFSYQGDPYEDGPGEFDAGSAGAPINEAATGEVLDESQATQAYSLGAERGMLDAMSGKPADPPLGLVPPTVQGSFAAGYTDGYLSVKPTATIAGGGGSSTGGTTTKKKTTTTTAGGGSSTEPLAEGMSTGTKIAAAGAGAALVVGAILIAKRRKKG